MNLAKIKAVMFFTVSKESVSVDFAHSLCGTLQGFEQPLWMFVLGQCSSIQFSVEKSGANNTIPNSDFQYYWFKGLTYHFMSRP